MHIVALMATGSDTVSGLQRMARPREFDETAVLDAAVQCFWAQGYEATSVRELAQKMGLAAASLYNAFGDKRALYRRALGHYVDHTVAHRLARYESDLAPREALSAFFTEIIERSLGDPSRKGCMLVNAAIDATPHDPQFRRAVAEVLIQMEAFFRRCVEAGQRDGTIAVLQSADDLARHLLGLLLGIRVLARVRPDRALLEGLLRPAFSLLDMTRVQPEATSN
jgi:TetR/AcrR family transcriptional regulator, transcriptional repressor for nem operon